MGLDHFFYQTKWWMRLRFPSVVWEIKTQQKEVFLTFDDGPTPEVTPWVLSTLAQYGAKATFFCLGKNVLNHPQIYDELLAKGHVTGNHTFDHVNGWKVSNSVYYSSIKKCANIFGALLFRPPYGKITRKQVKKLNNQYQVVLWSLLSGDYDASTTAEYCTNFLISKVKAGDIIVFHDSVKAFPKLKIILPQFLAFLHHQGYTFSVIPGSVTLDANGKRLK